jgi:hypothetical protein
MLQLELQLAGTEWHSNKLSDSRVGQTITCPPKTNHMLFYLPNNPDDILLPLTCCCLAC